MPVSAITKDDFTPRTAEDAARHFGRKVALPSEAFDRLTVEAKARAFRMAGVHNVRVVQRARDIVHKGIRDGTPFPEIRRQLLEVFDTQGIPRPALSRLRSMFQHNAQQAYSDGRREALDDPDMARAFPFRQYLTVGTGTPGVRGVRPDHAALHGKVFLWDDPFWNSHTPPWAWGCRCFFRSLTAAQVRRMGVKVVNLGYVRKRIRVAGQRRRGIGANADFARGKIDVSRVDAELRAVLADIAK